MIPDVAARTIERARVISEYGLDACTKLGATAAFLEEDHAYVLAQKKSTHGTIEHDTRCLVGLRMAKGNVPQAATLIGQSATALRNWMRDRRLPRFD